MAAGVGLVGGFVVLLQALLEAVEDLLGLLDTHGGVVKVH